METQEYKKMVLVLYACVGAEEYEFYKVPVNTTQDDLNEYSWQRAVEFADGYGIYPEPDFAVAVDDDGTEYSSDISGHWEDYDPDAHDRHTRCSTPSWQNF